MSQIHPSWKKIGGVALEIMEGKHDADLEYIRQACAKRVKMRFQRGQKMRLKGTRNVEIDGQEVTIVKVNQRSITVGIGEPDTRIGSARDPYFPDGMYNVSPELLVPLA